jgi:hypothetical protein
MTSSLVTFCPTLERYLYRLTGFLIVNPEREQEMKVISVMKDKEGRMEESGTNVGRKEEEKKAVIFAVVSHH